MACPGYHSPQFSEDAAWLPIWLQPYEHPNNEFHAKSQENAIPDMVKECQTLHEGLFKGSNTQSITSGAAKYTSCFLHLSGDVEQQVGSASCSDAMHFCLHLSSESTSQVSTGQYNEITHLWKHEMDKRLSHRSFSKNPAFIHGLACQYSCRDPTPGLGNSPSVFKKIVSSEPNTDQLIKTNQNIEHEFHGKLDGGDLKSTVTDDVVELSIAASEAVVISEMLFSSMQCEPLSDAAIIEIALRLKHARNECLLETAHTFSVADPDDTDRLSDLDENSMSDAFEDVGLTVEQVAETSICPFTHRKSSNSTQVSGTKQQEILKPDLSYACNVLAKDLVHERKALPENIGHEWKALPENIKGVCTGKTISQIQTKSWDNFPLNYSRPSLKDHTPEQEQKFHNKDALPVNQMGFMKHHCIQKVGKVPQPSNAKVKKHLKFFNWETSFLSESIDSLEQDVSQLKQSVELAVVSSSDTILRLSSSNFCSEQEPKHGAPLSQDYSRTASLFDPLCSVVPCSISSGVYVGYETKCATDGAQKSKNPITTIYSKCLDGNSLLHNNVMLQKPFLERIDLILSNSSERIVECSNKNDTELPGKWLDEGRSNNEQILEQNKIRVSTFAIQNTDNNDTQLTVHGDACSSPILEGCDVTMGGDMHESIKSLSASALGKCRSDDLTKKASYRSETINRSHIHVQSNLQSTPGDERTRKKRVRFQEAPYDMDGPKVSKLQPKCSCSGTATRCKSEYRWYHKYEQLISNRTVRNKEIIFQGVEFLLTGFSSCKSKDLEELIRRHGGYVLPNIPSKFPCLSVKPISLASRKLPVILCPKKVETTKFLYGCAVNAFIINVRWLVDSIQAGTALPPGKYMSWPIPGSKGNRMIIGEPFWRNNGMPIFHKVGIMLHGKVKFCTKFMKIVKHGGGHVFKSLQRLVQSLKNGTKTLGVVLVKNESCVSRHLKHCALEHDIPTMPASWIINSLLCGKLLSPKRDRCAPLHRIKMPSFPETQAGVDMSQEI
ncbi:uncharacterized protein LOC110017817 isoform X2 [Phalaenopsis equestris]|uniref:uncharacterized protein LOC110017817 isoform X2 n=1 Tax=Phalaenopsis equestris TaxID=78828 RepID=UPI0009E526CA|nr:uncharacterized protein LOC110017817 isoform X2 [Phalaenopsis equestris]